jgi:hypothetical protein
VEVEVASRSCFNGWTEWLLEKKLENGLKIGKKI